MKRKVALLMSLILVFSMVLTACSGAKKPDMLVVHVGPDPDTIDPALNSAVDGATLISHAFEGLMILDKDGVPREGQAKSYKVSDDGTTYTFTLRDGLKWSDGQPIKASDFVYAWNRAIAPETAADYEYIFDIIEGYDEGKLNVTAPDDKTLVVKLKAPVPYFLELCAFPTFFPVRQDIIEQYDEAWAVEPASYIGNGPYKMTEWVPGSHMIFARNENYWNYGALGPDKIKFVLMEDDNAVKSAFENGEILFADAWPNDEIDAWRDKPEFHIEGQLGTYYVSFNVTKPPLDNPKVRKALTLAVDRQWICENIGKAGQQPAGAYVPTGLSDADPTKEFREVGGDYYDPSGAAYEKNLEEAKKLLAEAGYPNGEGFPTLTYIYNEGTGHQMIGEALQDMWKKIGVNVTLESQEWNTFLNTRKNGDYYIARNGWLADYNDPITFLDMWVTGGGNNDAQWSNEEYDALITKIKTETDAKERFKMMHQAEDIIFAESMLCPIYYYVDIYLLNQKVEDFYASPLGIKYFMYAKVKE
ncbi:MAG: peptide ABC transporter substrate-binding protein [Clostridiaceae bacterium]|jgi:oligopeptide transport system substrate-binding protein|nr:peptide ABC transporter substrate-binding protein [Clostridiaceae bacterium]